MKRSKKLLLSIFSFSLIAAASAAITFSTISNTNNFANITKSKVTNQDDSTNVLVPSEKNDQNANLSTTQGPLTFWGNTITALDWFGSKLWSIDMSKENKDDKGQLPGTSYSGAWKRAWFNWDYNRTTNTLWVLGYYGGKNEDQKLFKINAATGSIDRTVSLGKTNGPRFVSALVSGNVMVYGNASQNFKNDATAILYNDKENKVSTISGNSKNNVPPNDGEKKQYQWYFFNLVPVAANKNFVEIVSYSNTTATPTTGDDGFQYASYDVYFILVDDNLNFIGNSYSYWKGGAVKVASGISGYRNSKITPQRDYYTMLDGNVVTVIYNTVIIIDTNSINISKFSMSDSKWILSWSLDSNENLFFKFKNDTKVYEVTSDTMKKATSQGSTISPITYLDLASINSKTDGLQSSSSSSTVASYANNYIIFNVFGYSGSLMLINEKYSEVIDASATTASTDTNNTDQYGLAIAVIQNPSNTVDGDYLGLLNTKNSIVSSADFTIEDSVLKSKLPSEITRNDIKTLNNSFFQDGTGYVPFTISNIKDKEGTFTVTANLYKIPWYSTTLPSNATPKKIEKNFSNANKITNKSGWITLNTTSNYDFMNSLPSTITVADVENLNPFQASFQSQTITDANGKQLYPSTKYEISSRDDSKGTISIKATYSYVPMGINYTNGGSGQVLTYESSQQYTVFKSGSPSQFNFTGGTTSASATSQTLNIDNVGQLKSYIQSGNLPSSIAQNLNTKTSDNSQYLQFINTDTSKGYPISKMTFSATGDDSAGTLKITASITNTNSPDKNAHSYTVTYTNLNKLAVYDFNFKDAKTIGTKNFDTMLASSVSAGDILSDLVTYKGFDSNNFNITLTPDDIKGTLTVNIALDKSYASSIGTNGHGFTNYVATKTYSGFLTTEQYNTRYSVTFKGDDDVALLYLKQIQPIEIVNSLGDGTNTNPIKKNLVINNKTYTNLNELVETLLVASKGTNIPTGWKDNNEIKTYMYEDNTLGYASFLVHIPQKLMSGASSDLDLIVNYTGFVKGNMDNTSDNMSFISDSMLENYLISKNFFNKQTFAQLTPTKFADWAKEHIKDLITFSSGQYTTKLNNNQYNVAIIPNDAQNTVSITINYGKMDNSQSLSEYSIQYTI
ncbi:MAG: hypothetical protein HUJ42_01805 [Malacoplasma sp.]|nr:hypothetical protein [Malacoplasma sp.]